MYFAYFMTLKTHFVKERKRFAWVHTGFAEVFWQLERKTKQNTELWLNKNRERKQVFKTYNLISVTTEADFLYYVSEKLSFCSTLTSEQNDKELNKHVAYFPS